MPFQKRKLLVCGASFVFLAIAVVLGNTYIENRKTATSVEFIMNTVVELRLHGKHSQEAVSQINKELRTYETSYSMYIENSDIWRINQNAGKRFTTVSADVLKLIQTAKKFSDKTGGLFDITIAPLTALWNVTAENPQIPDNSEIEETIKLVNYQDIIIKGNQVMLKYPGQAIDLGAIAKGNACEIIRQVAAEYDIQSGYASIGGNMVVLGDKPTGQPYLFGIRDPQGDASQYIGSISISGKTMATTGAYERFFEVNEKRYHHVLNPKTGYPAESDFLSVSVVAEDGALADFLSTALFLLGKNALNKAMDEPSLGIIAVDTQENVWISKNLHEHFTPNEKNKETVYQFIFQ